MRKWFSNRTELVRASIFTHSERVKEKVSMDKRNIEMPKIEVVKIYVLIGFLIVSILLSLSFTKYKEKF
ncbi:MULTISPECIES: hypothetical protein [Mesobacillus]|uniref:Holin-like toxin n=1 Tax=Mesobacillus stamsii TaxID=225347 RepID=A0ABU0FR15_9BACI|nr:MULTISPECIES: hypothetical protein [Mesobacillus]MDQ0412349.1 hypothetical protein [Mesobacillus stamsii]